jgi:endonuclease/exonuclease/phosphatase (EEP) superfamily protein YafD
MGIVQTDSGGPSRWTSTGPRAGQVVLVAVVVTLAALVLVPDLLGLDRHVVTAALLAVRPQVLAVTTLVSLAALLWRRARREAGAVLVICAVAGGLVLPRVVADPGAPASGPEMTVLSFNVDDGRASVPALAATIRATRPDVVVLPESAERFRALLARAIPDLAYRSFVGAAPGADDVHGITVLTAPTMGSPMSRVIDEGDADPWIELTGGRFGPLHVVAVHVAAPVEGKIESWPGELGQLATWCGSGAAPAIVAGDFNATDDHRDFRTGTAGCRDAGSATGQGLTATWDAAWPRWFGAQIDHVLTGHGPQPVALGILDLPGSDHRALLAHIELPRVP